MKTTFIFLFGFMWTASILGQVSINPDSTPPDPSAMLDVSSDDKGMLVPRMTQNLREGISDPANALLIYQTDGAKGFYYNEGSSAAPNWLLLGGEDLILTSRTPIEALPFTITDPGSYYLTDHLTGTTGISISSSNVTIDLNGYTIVGAIGSSGDGINATIAVENIKIMNGGVTGWADKGIDLVNGEYAQIVNINTYNNGGDGIETGDYVQLTHCQATGNSFDGFDIGSNSIVSNCLAHQNTDNGIEVDDFTTISNSSSSENSGAGFNTQTYASISGSTAQGNSEDGFVLGNGSIVNGSTATSNGENGFSLNSACQASGNIARNNTNHGFSTLSDGFLHKNHSDGNTLSGYYTISSGSRFEGNQSSDNGTYGFDIISSFGCILLKNSASGNTVQNYNLSANNAAPMTTSATIDTADNPFANIDF